MNEIIKIQESNGSQYVNARDLHTELEVKRDFPTWIKDRIEKYGFSCGFDYVCIDGLRSPISGSAKARPQATIEYHLTISMAKELAMVENTDKGREVRLRLIMLEEAWNKPEMVMARALQMSQRVIDGYQKQLAIMAPKADFFDQVTSSKDAIEMKEAAKVLNMPGIGRNNLFQILRDKKILMDNNTPFQAFIDRGYFRVIESKWVTPEGETKINLKTVVYQKGLDFIRRMVTEK